MAGGVGDEIDAYLENAGGCAKSVAVVLALSVSLGLAAWRSHAVDGGDLVHSLIGGLWIVGFWLLLGAVTVLFGTLRAWWKR